jgi:Ca-activated chloride channel family protein
MTTSPAPRRVRTDVAIALTGAVVMVLSFFVVPAGSDPRADCGTRVDLEISVSTEKEALIAELADDYENAGRVVRGVCADQLVVHGLSSGRAKNALAAGWKLNGESLPPEPQLWLPTSSMWPQLLAREAANGDAVTDPAEDSLGSVTASTLVIAMPEAVADTLEKAKAPLTTWNDVLALAGPTAGWRDYGRPEWGRFLLGRDNPDVSTSGLAATVATYHAAPGDISQAALKSTTVVNFVHGIESSVSRYGDEAVDFMVEIFDEEHKNPEDASYRPYVDAVVVQEQMTYAYNCGAPNGKPAEMDCDRKLDRPLTVVHPDDGTLLLDHPFVPLASADPGQRAVAADFFAFLREDAQQQRFRDFGFRDPERPDRPTDELVKTLGLPPDQRLTFVEQPSADLVATMLANWKTVKKRARVLLVLDVSKSMGDPVDDPNKAVDPSKLELVKPAAKKAIDLLSDDDEVGLWTFSSGPHEQVYPMTPVGRARTEIKREIDALQASGATALYSTVEQAYEAMAANTDPEWISAVVLLSDGKNTEGYSNAGLDDAKARKILLGKLNPEGRDTSVRIFTIPYGTDHVPVDVLNAISRATKAVNVEASDPLDIDEAFVGVFQNFG